MFIKNFIIYSFLILVPALSSQQIKEDFTLIDKHADKAPAYLKRSIPALVNYLIKPAEDETQKVRAIFRWISQNITYDVDAYFDQRLIVEEPEKVIRRGRAVCGGYAQLFKRMCKEAGIQSEIIAGWSKGYIEQLSPKPNHAWNAVKINQQWHLLDVTWGSGYINDQQTYSKAFQGHYFLTEPNLLIYDHLPEDEKWQQLDQPISRKQFEDLILLRPDFFATGLSLVSHQESTINVTEELVIKIAAPITTYLNAELIKNNKVLPDNFVFSQRLNNAYLINVHFPDEGKYILRVYSKSGKEQKLYNWACDYNINVKQNVNSSPFVKQFSSFYDLNGYLYYPLDLYLNAGSNQAFKIEVNNALEVSLLVNENRIIPFKKENNIYRTNITPESGPLRIMAKTDTTNTYQFLLEYQVK